MSLWLEYHESASTSSCQLDHEILIHHSNPVNEDTINLNKCVCEWCGRVGCHEGEDHMTRVPCTAGRGLFVGAAWNANNMHELAQAKVGTILSMAQELGRKVFPNTFVYKHFALEDDEREFAIPTLIDSTLFISQSLNARNGSVLVHCAMGKSRSVSAVLAYVMHSTGATLDEALQQLRQKRPIARPNSGYVNQLQALEILFRALHPLPILRTIREFFL